MSVTSELAVNREHQMNPNPLVFSHAFSDDENVAALRKCFKDSALHPTFQQPVLKEFLKQMCSVVGIGKEPNILILYYIILYYII